MNPQAFGLAMGAFYAVFMAMLAWISGLFRVGRGAVEETAKYYPGYRATPFGGLVGALYGLATGFIMGWIVGYLYNAFQSRTAQPPSVDESVVEAWEESEL